MSGSGGNIPHTQNSLTFSFSVTSGTTFSLNSGQISSALSVSNASFNVTNITNTSFDVVLTSISTGAGSINLPGGTLTDVNGTANGGTSTISWNKEAEPTVSLTIYVAAVEGEPSSYSFSIGGTTVSHIPNNFGSNVSVTLVSGKSLDDIVNNTLQYNCPGGAGDYLEPHMLSVRAGPDTTRSNWVSITSMNASPGPSPPYSPSPGTTGTGTYNFNSARKSAVESHVASNPSHTNIIFEAASTDHD